MSMTFIAAINSGMVDEDLQVGHLYMRKHMKVKGFASCKSKGP